MRKEVKLVSLFAGALVLLQCGSERVSSTQEGSPVQVGAKIEEVTTTIILQDYEAVGTVRSKVATTVSSKILGNITAIHIEEGERVRKGELLVEIDSRDSRIRLQRAEAGLQEAKAALVEVERSIDAGVSAKQAAEASAQLATSTYHRFQELLKKQSVSQQEFDEAQARFTSSQAEVRRAAEMLLSARAKKAQVEARITQAESNIESVRLSLSYSRVTSPISGLVVAKMVEVGQLAAPGLPLVSLDDDRQYQLETLVRESLLGHIKAGSVAMVLIGSSGLELEGEVVEIVPMADPASRTFTVKVSLPQNPALRSGLFGRARFSIEERETLTIPQAALIERGQLVGVYVVDLEGKARFRLIRTGKRQKGRVEVLSGVESGERVVISPLEKISEGVELRLSGGLIQPDYGVTGSSANA